MTKEKFIQHHVFFPPKVHKAYIKYLTDLYGTPHGYKSAKTVECVVKLLKKERYL